MAQTAHTPGPWEAWDDGYTVGFVDEEGEPFAVLEIVDHGDMADPAQLRADQLLASAAPEMLKALVTICDPALTTKQRFEAFKSARAAIAKAEGR